MRLFHPVVESWHMQLTDDRLVSNAWVLHNCFTEHIKKLTPNAAMRASVRLGKFFKLGRREESMADEQRMPYKQYAKFEKLFFLYGSTVKMLEPVRLNEWRTVSEQIWAWAKERVSSTVEEYTDGFLDPPPEVGTPGQESPDESALA